METQKIILTIVASMLAVDLLVLFLIPIIRKQIKDHTDSINDEFLQIVQGQKQSTDSITLLRSELNIRHREVLQTFQDLFTKIDLIHSKVNEVNGTCNNFNNLATDFSDTIRKERIEYYQLKDKFKIVSSKSQHNILQAQYDAVCRERDELKNELDKNKPIEVLTDDREANRLLAEKIANDKLNPLSSDFFEDLATPNKKRKYCYHAYNTPERMKELRRLKAEKKKMQLKKKALVEKLKGKLMLDSIVGVAKRGRPKKKTTEPSVIIKNKVGRPKGSKNKIKN